MATYPRAQTVATFIVCTVVVLGASLYTYGNPFISTNAPENSSVFTKNTIASANDTYIDTADWKKTFFSVNEKNAKNYSTENAKNISKTNNEPELTATDLFGRELFSKFMTLRQAGMISDTNTTDALVNQILDNSQLITDEAKFSTAADLYTFTSEDSAALQIYANTVANILKRDQPVDNEVLVTKKALESGDLKLLENIDQIISTYARVRSDLLTTPVPFSASAYHIKLVNGVAKALANAVALRNSAVDPLQALEAISSYPETVSVVFYAIVDLRNYFDQAGITFNPNEDAYSVFSLK